MPNSSAKRKGNYIKKPYKRIQTKKPPSRAGEQRTIRTLVNTGTKERLGKVIVDENNAERLEDMTGKLVGIIATDEETKKIVVHPNSDASFNTNQHANLSYEVITNRKFWREKSACRRKERKIVVLKGSCIKVDGTQQDAQDKSFETLNYWEFIGRKRLMEKCPVLKGQSTKVDPNKHNPDDLEWIDYKELRDRQYIQRKINKTKNIIYSKSNITSDLLSTTPDSIQHSTSSSNPASFFSDNASSSGENQHSGDETKQFPYNEKDDINWNDWLVPSSLLP